ncbi:hypothetical protein [Dokdonella sp.]|uniref:hypothetical protein n=1 Tax=Dokdonella sp. TaxID=2291710 RepID=UPI0035280728
MKITPFAPALLVLGIAVGLSACGKKEEAPAPVVAPAPAPAVETAPPPAPVAEAVTFSRLSLGNAVDANQAVTAPATTFAPTDTVYAAVETTGAAPNAAIVARWTYSDGQLVDETSQSIAPDGAATTTFHIAKPDGFPEGSYKVDIMIDGAPVASQSFEVKAPM